jgi:hypothetical protein
MEYLNKGAFGAFLSDWLLLQFIHQLEQTVNEVLEILPGTFVLLDLIPVFGSISSFFPTHETMDTSGIWKPSQAKKFRRLLAT